MSIRRNISIVGLLPVFLAACAVGPDYQSPAAPEGAAGPMVSLDTRAETLAVPPEGWWHLYQDPVLDQLLQQAFDANYDLRAARANLSAARALLDASRGGRYPSTEANVAGIRGRDAVTDEILEIGDHPPVTGWTFDTVLDVSYEVDLFGHVQRSIEAAQADADSVAATHDTVKITVAAETARAYGQICALGEQVDVTRHSIEVVKSEADISERRLAAGGGSEFDVVRAQALVAQVRATLPPLEGRRRAALFELSALLGKTPADAPVDLLNCRLPPKLTELMPVGDGATLLRRRPDIRRADRLAAAATARIGVATAELYPRVSLLGFAGGVGAQLSDLTAARGLTWGLGPSISWTFPNQTVPRARVRQAKASAEEAVANLDSTILEALKETEQSLSAYNAELERRESLNDAQRLAHRAFILARAQLAAGAVSHLDLLASEQALVTADSAVASSDANLLDDQIQVFKSLGGGWR